MRILVPAAADICCVSERTVWRWIKAGKVNATMIDKRTYLDFDEVMSIADSPDRRKPYGASSQLGISP